MKLFKWIKSQPFTGQSNHRAYFALEVLILAACIIYLQPLFLYLFPEYSVYYGIRIIFVSSVVFACLSYIFAPMSNAIYHKKGLSILWLGVFWGAYCSLRAIFVGARIDSLILSIGSYATIVYLIAIGGSAFPLRKLFRLFLFLFYVIALIMFLTKDIHLDRYINASLQEVDLFRNTDTLAYKFNLMLYTSIFFLFTGFFWKGTLSRVERFLCVSSIFPFAYFVIGRSLFRNALATLCLSFGLILFYSIKKIRIWSFLLLCFIAIVGGGLFYGTLGDNMRQRLMDSSDRQDEAGIVGFIKNERGSELECMLNSMSTLDIVFGRGFGATYDASELFGENGAQWGTVHMGFMIMLLWGGVGFLFYFPGIFIAASFKHLPKGDDGFLLACKCYIMVETVRRWFCPYSMNFGSTFANMLLYLAIGAMLADGFIISNRNRYI